MTRAVGFGVWALGCATLAPPVSPKPQTPLPGAVSISQFRFTPAELTVSAGDTVVWTNDDALAHTASADSGAWSSPELQRGERFQFVPTRAGRFPYHCSAHPVMRATLVVRP